MAGSSAIDWISFALGVLVGIAICFLLMRRKRAQDPPAQPIQAIE